MRRHAHHGAVAASSLRKHILPTQTGTDAQSADASRQGQWHALLLLRRELGLGRRPVCIPPGRPPARVAGRRVQRQRMLGATAQKVTPMMVSARVVNT